MGVRPAICDFLRLVSTQIQSRTSSLRIAKVGLTPIVSLQTRYIFLQRETSSTWSPKRPPTADSTKPELIFILWILLRFVF